MGKLKSIIVFFTVIVFALTIYSSCDSSTEPELEPGSRDYIWTVDTLPYQSGSQYRMWGNTPNNIWTVGSSLEHEYNILHYDGNSWQPNSTPNMPSMFCIWGTDNGYIFAGSRNGEIWRKIGDTDWELFHKFIYEVDLSKVFKFYDITGTSNDNFYMVGSVFGGTDNEHTFIIQYSNGHWKINHYPQLNTTFTRIKSNKNSTYTLEGAKLSNITEGTTTIHQYDGNELTTLYFAESSKINNAMIQNINGEVLYRIGYKVYERVQNSFDLIYSNEDTALITGYFNGNSKKDIFFGAIDGIMHFNGTDTKYLIKIGENEIMYISGSVHFGNESYFLGENSTRNENYIFHCILKE